MIESPIGERQSSPNVITNKAMVKKFNEVMSSINKIINGYISGQTEQENESEQSSSNIIT